MDGWLGRWVGVSCGAWVVFCRPSGSRCRVGSVVVFGRRDGDFDTVQDVDPGELDCRSWGVGVVEILKCV